MNQVYTIKDLENLTGIKAHTLRIWEKRYNVLHPKRSETNIRHYTDDDLKKIMNVSLLCNHGLKISKIASLSEGEMLSKINELMKWNKNSVHKDFDAILQSTIQMDSDRIEKTLEKLFLDLGMVDMYIKIIEPLLVKIGNLWQLKTISVSHEHLFSNILRKFILSKTNSIVPTTKLDKKVLIFLIPEEQHETPILFYHYILKELGWECIYLGQNVPLNDLEMAYQQTSPDLVLTSLITRVEPNKFSKQINELLSIIPQHKLCLSGASISIHFDEIPEKINTILKLEDLNGIFNSKS